MTAVKIAGTFRKDERPFNGLETIAKELLDRGRAGDRFVVVALVRPHAAKWTADDGVEVPTVRFDHIEVLEGEAARTGRDLLEEAYQQRTGNSKAPELPLDGDDPDDD